MADRVLVSRFRLEDARHLFVRADDPFSPDYEISPAIEVLAYDLYTTTGYKDVHLTLELPPEDLTPEGVERIRVAIQRYCASTARELDRTRRGERSRGLIALGAALIALACFVGINRVLRDESGFWVDVFTEGIVVAFWVALWFPLDTLLFGQWQHRLDRRIYTTLADLDLEVVPLSVTDPSTTCASAS